MGEGPGNSDPTDAAAAQADAPAPQVLIQALHKAKGHQKDAILQQISAMEKKLWKKTDSWGPCLAREAERRNAFMLYATCPAKGDAIAGYILFTVSGLVSHISKVLVVPAWRRQGIGRRLVQAAIEFSQEARRVGSVTLHVDVGNAPAVLLYQGFGFVSEGTLHDYYSPGRHAYKMRLEVCNDY